MKEWTTEAYCAWFSGFNSDLVGTAWVGFDQERPLGDNEEGGRTALPIWIYFMKEALRGQPEHTLTQPEGVVSMRISAETGKANERGMFEYFLADHLPEGNDEESSESASSPGAAGNDGLF